MRRAAQLRGPFRWRVYVQKYKLFTSEVTQVAAQYLAPQDWSRPYQHPVSKTGKVLKGRVKHYGSDCTMCPKRAEARGSAPIHKPLVFKPTLQSDTRTMYVVVDVTDYTKSVYSMVKKLRYTGFSGYVVVDLVARCGGGRVDDVDDGTVRRCAPHVAFTFKASNPDYVLLCGSRATKSFLGTSVNVLSNPGSWQVLAHDGKRIPVLCVPSTVDMAKNYLHRKEMQVGVKWMLSGMWEDEAPRLDAVVKVIEDEDDLEAFEDWHERCSWLAFDTETTGKLFTSEFNIATIAFARHDSRVTWCVSPDAMNNPAVVKAVKRVLTSKLVGKVGQNTKYDVHACRQHYGVKVAPVIGDTRLMYKLLNAEGAADLEAIAATIGVGGHKKEAVTAVKAAAAKLRAEAKAAAGGRALKRHEFDAMSYAYGQIDMTVLMRYCALDTYVTALLYDKLFQKLDEHPFLGVTWKRKVLPASRVFTDIEATGVRVDLPNVELARKFIEAKLGEVDSRIRSDTGIEPTKPATIRAYFEKHNLQPPWLTEKTQLTATDSKALKKMKAMYSQHTVLADLIDFRKYAKLAGSYLESLPYYVRDDGRVHPSIYIDGARTGRLTCVTGDMEFATSTGKERVASLVDVDFSATPVYVWTHELRWERLSAVWPTGMRRTVRVRLSNGEEIRCTPDHRLRSRDGWIQAGDSLGVELQTGEPGCVGEIQGEQGHVPELAQDVVWRRPEGVGGGRRVAASAPPVGVATVLGRVHVEDGVCCSRGEAPPLLRELKVLEEEWAGGGCADSPRNAPVAQEYREHEGPWAEESHPSRGTGGDGEDWTESVAAAPQVRVQRVPDRHELQALRYGAAGEPGCDGQHGVDVLLRPGAHGARVPGAGGGAGQGQRQPGESSAQAVQVVAEAVFGDAQDAPRAEVVREALRGVQAAILCGQEVRGGERCGAGAVHEKGGAQPLHAGRSGHGYEVRGLHPSWEAGAGGGWVCTQAAEGQGRGADVNLLESRVFGHAGDSSPRCRGPERRGGRSPEYARVVAVEDAGYAEVYDFTVERDHSAYISGVYAHNCSDPSLHQVPQHGGEEAKMVKNCFVAERGNVIIQADFKTLEVYVNAAWSNDRKMIEALESGVDFHTNTACLVGPYAWGMSPEEVLAEITADLAKPDGKSPKRNMAKRTTFGVLYGMGPDSLAEEIHATKFMAASMIKGFFTAYPDTNDRMARAKQFVAEHGYIEIPDFDGYTPARIRPLRQVGYTSDNYYRSQAMRAATNSPIQGMASDICTNAAVKLAKIFKHDYLGEPRILITVHDSVLVECHESMAVEIGTVIRDVMTEQRVGPLKLVVDVEYGKAWGNLKKLPLAA